MKTMLQKRYQGIDLKIWTAAAAVLMLCLSACDGSGGLGKSENCTCPKPIVKLRETPIENVTGSGIAGYADDGDMDTVRYIVDNLKDDPVKGVPLPRWCSALKAAIQSGHLKIAEYLMKEMRELPEDDRTLSKRDWDGLVRFVAESNLSTCDALRFIFKHAKDEIDNPLERVAVCNMSDCKLQACIDYGFLKQIKGDNYLILSALPTTKLNRPFLGPLTEEEIQSNKKITAETIAKVKRLLDNGVKPNKQDIEHIKSELDSKKSGLARDTEQPYIEMLEKVLKLLDEYK